MDKVFRLFLVWLIAFLILIACLWLVPGVPDATGGLHPEFKTMLKSGDSMADTPATKWMAYLFGLGIIGIFGFALVAGARKKEAVLDQKIRRFIIFTVLVYAVVFTLTTFSYWSYHQSNSMEYFGGFPKPTAWMLYGCWFTPLLLTITYYYKFQSWVITPEEEEQFDKIVKARREREQST